MATPRRVLLALAILALLAGALALAGCGGDDEVKGSAAKSGDGEVSGSITT